MRLPPNKTDFTLKLLLMSTHALYLSAPLSVEMDPCEALSRVFGKTPFTAVFSGADSHEQTALSFSDV